MAFVFHPAGWKLVSTFLRTSDHEHLARIQISDLPFDRHCCRSCEANNSFLAIPKYGQGRRLCIPSSKSTMSKIPRPVTAQKPPHQYCVLIDSP